MALKFAFAPSPLNGIRVDPLPVESPRALALRTSLLANGERGAGVSSFFFSCPSLFFPFSSLVLGLGFGIFPSPFFLRQNEKELIRLASAEMGGLFCICVESILTD